MTLRITSDGMLKQCEEMMISTRLTPSREQHMKRIVLQMAIVRVMRKQICPSAQASSMRMNRYEKRSNQKKKKSVQESD